MKKPLLVNTIFSLFFPPQKNSELQLYLTNIIKYLTSNNSNNEEIIQKYPNLIANLINILASSAKPEFQIDKQIFKNELEAFVNLVGENFRKLIDDNIILESDIKAICEMYSHDEDYGEKLKEILRILNEMDESQQLINSFNKDVIVYLLDSSISLKNYAMK